MKKATHQTAATKEHPTLALLRSGAVGAAATLADLGMLVLLVEVVALSPEAANIPALLLGVFIQFFGNKFFAFRDPSRDYLRQGGLFALVEIGTFALNAGLFFALVTLTPLPYLLARLAGTALVYFAFSFPLWRLIFQTPPQAVVAPSLPAKLVPTAQVASNIASNSGD